MPVSGRKRPYHLPVLSNPDFGVVRAPGPGLGNLLFPIARAVIGRETLGGTLVMPTMRQIKIGPFVRLEKDKRTYGDVFRHRTRPDWSSWALSRLQRKRSEHQIDKSAPVIRYQGTGRQFHDLNGYSAVLGNFLKSASRSKPNNECFDIAVHVRLSDFQPVDSNAHSQNIRLPFEWYRHAIELAVEKMGGGVHKGVLFSDENPEELISKLGLKNFVPEPPGNALTTVLTMSKAQILVGSRSTFSLWAQFIGQNQAIWPKGYDLAKYKPVDISLDHFV